MADKGTVYLIAHCNPQGTGVAQATVTAKDAPAARRAFYKLYPQRAIHTMGVRGEG